MVSRLINHRRRGLAPKQPWYWMDCNKTIQSKVEANLSISARKRSRASWRMACRSNNTLATPRKAVKKVELELLSRVLPPWDYLVRVVAIMSRGKVIISFLMVREILWRNCRSYKSCLNHLTKQHLRWASPMSQSSIYRAVHSRKVE